jgi:hypothetical protein
MLVFAAMLDVRVAIKNEQEQKITAIYISRSAEDTNTWSVNTYEHCWVHTASFLSW